MNKRVHDSKLLRQSFNIRSICLSYANDISDIGKLSFRKIYRIFFASYSLIKEIIFRRPKLVYFQISPFNEGFIRDFFFVCLIRFFRVRILYHLRGKGIKHEAKNILKKNMYKFVFQDEEVICLSNLLVHDISDVFFGKIHVVNNGIQDIEPILRNTSQKKNGKIKLLFISNLIKSKGIFDFLEALSILKTKNISFDGMIVGAEGDLSEQELLNEINSRDLNDCIKYFGKMYGIEKYDVLKQTDIIVFPTKNDAFPAIPIEAMQFNIPIVSTFEGAIPEIVDNRVTGFLVEKDCPKAIAEKVQILIKDSDLRKKMGKAARKKYEEKYTLQHFENRMKTVFEEVLNDVNEKH